jgi:hypothetical protein
MTFSFLAHLYISESRSPAQLEGQPGEPPQAPSLEDPEEYQANEPIAAGIFAVVITAGSFAESR